MLAGGWKTNDTLTGALIAAVAAIIGSLLSGAYQHFLDWWRRPVLTVRVLRKDSAPNITQAEWTDNGHLIQKTFARISVSNSGRRSALNTKVFLMGIDEVISENAINPRYADESVQIPWSGHVFEGKNLPKGLTLFADLVSVDKVESGWEFPADLPITTKNDLRPHHGTFRFGLVVTADNSEPSYSTISVDYWGDWHKIRIWKFSDKPLKVIE